MLNALTGSFTGQLTLYFSETRKQAHDKWSKLSQSLGINQPIQRSDMYALLLKVVEAVDHLHLRPTQPIKLRHHQFVPSL